MYPGFKSIRFVLILCVLLCSRQNSHAWQFLQSDSLTQSEAGPKQIEVAPNYNEGENNTDEDWDEEGDEEIPPETFNATHFNEIQQAPAATRRNVSDAAWNKMSKDPDFNYQDADEKANPSDNSNAWWAKMFGNIFLFLLSPFGKFLEISLVVALVLFIVFRIVKLNGNFFFSRKDKKLGNTSADDLEDYVPEDWEVIIHDAAQSGNFRLALRHSYRYLLSMLETKNLIQYQIAKTNYQYVYELSGTHYYKPFMQLTRDYEYAWYGGFEIEKAFFDKYYNTVSGLKKELNF